MYICRNIEQFNYGRELMKVIRRIIKSQPRQGQQFGTNHLLVTYSILFIAFRIIIKILNY